MKKFLLFAACLFTASSVSAQTELIKEQPAGTLRTFHGSSKATSVSWGYASTADHDGVARQVVFADNGTDVYFKDPLTKALKDSWIKGTLKDGIITVETPQLIDQTTNSKTGETVNWCVQRFKKVVTGVDEDGDDIISYEVDNEKTAMTYIYRNDSIIQEDKDIKLTLTSDGEYMIYGEEDVVYTAVKETASSIPKGAEVETWSFKYGSAASQIKVAQDGNELIFKGIWSKYPEACIKGIIDGDKVYIPSQQYLGFLTTTSNSYYTYFMAATEFMFMGIKATYTTSKDPIVMTYDKEAKTITSDDENIFGIIRYGKTPDATDQSPLDKFKNIRFSYIDKIYNPVTPTINIANGFGYYPTYSWGKFEFDVPAVDIEGNALNVDNFYYSIWMDGEVLTIDPEDATYNQYKGLTEPITEVPFTFDNGSGITKEGTASGRYFMFFKLGFDEIGVQSIYYDDISGECLKSDIAYYNRNTKELYTVTGISAANSDASTITGITYYDLCGNKVSTSYNGIAIKVVRFANGATKTSKTILRR